MGPSLIQVLSVGLYFFVCMKPHFLDRTQNQLKWRLGHEPTFFFFYYFTYNTVLLHAVALTHESATGVHAPQS